MPKRKPGRPRKDQLSAAESYRTDAETAVKMAKDLIAITDAEPDKLEKHPQFPGVSNETGDRINMITIMRIHGYWDNEIAEKLGIGPADINKLERKYPQEFNQAEATALTTAVHKLEVNILRVRAAAAKRAPEMLEVLATLAHDDTVKPHIRRDCARDWLNIMGMNMPVARGGTQNVLNAGTIVALQQRFDDGTTNPSNVIDAEVVDD